MFTKENNLNTLKIIDFGFTQYIGKQSENVN